MEIVIEESLFVNFVLIFCIIRFTALLTRQKARFVFLMSFCGAIIACAYPAFNITGVLIYIILIATVSLITLTSFKYLGFKKFMIDFGVNLLATFTLGGVCLAIKNAVGCYPLFIVAVIACVMFLIAGVIMKAIRRKNNLKKFTFKLTLKDGDKVVEEEGYLDSGNVLYDSITNKPIVLVNFEVFQKFYGDISYFNARLQNMNSSSIKNGHYIKINSIGKGTSMLVFTIDELTVEDRYFKNVSLGLSFSGFEKSFGKNVLLHCDYI